MTGNYRVGTAGWGIPAAEAEAFPGPGTHLERYGRILLATEINTSFYRPHRPATYERWAASVPDGFRFAVKLPREITHVRRLVDVAEPLDRFLGEVAGLGGKLGPVLIQLPPSLRFAADVAVAFFQAVRAGFGGTLVCEPRHPSWFDAVPDALLVAARIARVAADPAPVPQAAVPGGWDGLTYRRLHGSPEMYASPYGTADIQRVAGAMRADIGRGSPSWCIFDNTMHGAAARNARDLQDTLQCA